MKNNELLRHSAGNGLHLGAEAKENLRNAILADVGFLHALINTPAARVFPSWDALAPAVRGQLRYRIVPLEIKAGAAGAMKSLHQFMHEKHLVFERRVRNASRRMANRGPSPGRIAEGVLRWNECSTSP